MPDLLPSLAHVIDPRRHFPDEDGLGINLRHGKQAIVVGDCLELLLRMETQSVDVVVTSPPYNIGTSYQSCDDRMTDHAYLEWMRELAVALARVLKPRGSIFLNIDGSARQPWQAHDVAGTFRKHFQLQNEFVWVKSISIDDRTVGHFKPLNSTRFVNRNHEKLYHFTFDGDVPIDRLAIGVPYVDKSNLKRWNSSGSDVRCRGNTWFVPYPTVNKKAQRANHPASFPVELAERCLRLAGGKGRVLDPFVGIGSTLVAAEKLGMEGVGIEMDPQYASAAYERLKGT